MAQKLTAEERQQIMNRLGQKFLAIGIVSVIFVAIAFVTHAAADLMLQLNSREAALVLMGVMGALLGGGEVLLIILIWFRD